MARTLKIAFFLLSVVIGFIPSRADVPPDSLSTAIPIRLTAGTDTTESRPNFIKKIINYFGQANKPTPHKGVDFSFLGGPHFSSETKLGLGLVAAANYYTSPEGDSITRLSNASLFTDITTGGFYKVGVRGNHFALGNKWRLNYNVSFYSFLRKFWGIGYEAGANYNECEKFTELFIDVYSSFLYNLGHNIYLGPSAEFAHIKGNNVKNPALWDNQRLSTYTTSVGFSILYDSRDNITATQTGWLASLSQRFCPRFLGNHYAFSSTEIKLAGFRPLWKGSILGLSVHAAYNYGNVPWGMLATFGGSDNMRGYYEGRFRDKCELDATLELRQHVWRRNGIVVWVGAGSVFPRPCKLNFRHILPNGGIGYRWEFKKNTNVRLDFGVGKGETSFIFNINEAF